MTAHIRGFGDEMRTLYLAEEKDSDRSSSIEKLFELFRQGYTPKTITKQQLAEVFGINASKFKEDPKKLSNKITKATFRLFNLSFSETLDYQYQKFLNTKQGS